MASSSKQVERTHSASSQSTDYPIDEELDTVIATVSIPEVKPNDLLVPPPPRAYPTRSGLGKRKDPPSPQHVTAPPGKKKVEPPIGKPHILASYPPDVLVRFPVGIQWEIARLLGPNPDDRLQDFISHCNSNNATDHWELATSFYQWLGGNPETGHLYEAESAASSPWQELDYEDEAFQVSENGLLGCNENGDFLSLPNDPSWHGGKVHFSCRLVQEQRSKSLKLIMEKPILGPSNRFSRRFTSGNFIRVRVAGQLLYTAGHNLKSFFHHPFLFNNRVYRALYAKDNVVVLIQTSEERTYEGEDIMVRESTGNKSVPSFLEFLAWHNNLDLNSSQSMAKWASRFALGLSNSVPGIRISPEQYKELADIENITSTSLGSKVPNELVMTDGCGLASSHLLAALHHKFQWQSFPTAVQCRIKGAKGLLLLHPTFHHPTPEIWIRPSQTKIHHPLLSPGEGGDPALHIVEVLRSSHMKSPASLSSEILINLAENGVSMDLLSGMLKDALKERIIRLTQWDDDVDLRKLWSSVAKEGSILTQRLARQNTSYARVLGHRFEDPDEEIEDDLQDGQLEEHSVAWWEDPVSGCPSTLEDTVLHLLDSGFHPDHSPILQAKLYEVVKKVLKIYVSKFKINVQESCTAFIVPDPTGVLEPGEVHIKSSSNNLLGPDGRLTDIIVGDVLLTRHPCKVASDVQKARAVVKAELHKYRDVIVISTKGHVVGGQYLPRHLASMTGGGDYDGDLMFAFWTPSLVQSFEEADPSFADRPIGLDEYLIKSNETVQQFRERVPIDAPYTTQIYELQKHLLSALQNADVVGRVSGMWETSMYINGYNHPKTVMLANLFCEVLDGAKTGITINPQHYKTLQRDYSQAPPWKMDTKKPSSSDFVAPEQRKPLQRSSHLGTFIMDELKKQVDAACHEHKVAVGKKLDPGQSFSGSLVDQDLTAPFRQAEERAAALLQSTGSTLWKDALEAIRIHVKTVRAYWQEQVMPPRVKGSKGSFTDLAIEKRQDTLRRVSRKFADDPDGGKSMLVVNQDVFSPEEWRRLKASYAYIYDHEVKGSRGWSRFPFDVAFRELCHIKADAVSRGRTKPVKPEFYMGFTMHKGFTKV